MNSLSLILWSASFLWAHAVVVVIAWVRAVVRTGWIPMSAIELR